MNIHALKLCLITHLQNQSFNSYKNFILKAIQGGITSVQLREKTSDLTKFRILALQLKSILQPSNTPLIINDQVDIAKEVDADGVHLGQSDLSPDVARKIVGPSKLIGLSVESFTELEMANQLTSINYIAASAVFPSKNKSNCKMVWGLDGLQQITKLSKHPVVAVGGINSSNIGSVIDNGAFGAAVIGAIHGHNPKNAAAELIVEIENSFTKRGCYAGKN
jgi:thiamine-phosphate pyrophosphorylase